MTPTPASRPLCRRSRRIVWLLAWLVWAQSGLVGVLTTLGPSHRHETTSVGVVVLEDVRRAVTPRQAPASHVLTAFGHFHSTADPQRHHHRGDDGSVVIAEADTAAAADHDGAGGAGPAFIALLGDAPRWHAAAGRAVPARRAAWPSLTDDPEPLERPPRLA